MLSEQPAVPKDITGQVASQDWLTLRQHLEGRLNALRTWRSSWWMMNWSDLAEFILPRRSIWLTQSAGGFPTPNNMSRGRPLNGQIVDPTATLATRVCAGGLMSGLASPSRPWFKIIPASKTQEVDDAARMYVDEVEDRMYTVLAESNFYNSFAQECEDLVVFGNGPSIIYEDEQDLIRLYNPCVGEYYMGTDATGRIDCLNRMFLMTVSQAVSFFGADHTAEDIRRMWEAKGNQLEQERLIAHSIEPNFAVADAAGNKCGVVPGNFTWREVYWLWGKNESKPLSMRGFVDQPFTSGRWTVQSNDAYGRSPGMDVLPDVMQLQVMTRRKAEAIEKQVRPPLVAEMSLKNQPSSGLPGHVTYVSEMGAGKGMRPIFEVQPDLQYMSADILAIEQRIKVGLFNDLFLMLEQAPNAKMTAYEVAQKMQEKLQVLGPVIESLISESLKPKLKRIYGILNRKGMLPPLPDSLKGVPLTVQFVSILALAQKAAATGGLERIIGIVGNMFGVYPEVKYILDPDAYLREFNELLGNPQKILRGADQVQALKQADQQKAAQQQAMAGADHATQIAGQGAQVGQLLANTDVGGGTSALSAILGTGGGGAGPQGTRPD